MIVNSADHINMPDDLSGLSDTQLMKLERQIARKYSGKTPWLIVIWSFTNLAFWFALWPMVIWEIIPLWLAFILATISIALVYLPTHDAQHDIIARKGQKLRWLNETIGHATSWIITLPFNVLRHTHLDHHRHVNNPELDPDYSTNADGPWAALWRAVKERQPSGKRTSDYFASLERSGRLDLIKLAVLYKIGFITILSTLAWNGLSLEAFFLWWLPYHIAVSHQNFFLSWAPHHPGHETSRYRNSRSWKSVAGTIGSMGMEYHIVHHLHPYIPLHLTPAAYREMRPILVARGAELGEN